MGAYEIDDQLLTAEDKKALTANKEQQMISRKKGSISKTHIKPNSNYRGSHFTFNRYFFLLSEKV